MKLKREAEGIMQKIQNATMRTKEGRKKERYKNERSEIRVGPGPKDKEIEKVLSLLPHSAAYYFTQAHIPRAIEAGLLQEKARQFDLRGNIYPDVNAALSGAKDKAGKNDLIVVCGSVFLVGEVNF